MLLVSIEQPGGPPQSLSSKVSAETFIWGSAGAYLVLLRVIKKIGPVGVSLHDMELKQLP